MKIQKVLIANRGEIACRVMRTCRDLGIETVAIYSEGDRHAKHVKEADEAFCVGPDPATTSYLNQEKIIEVCKKSGAQAIHPGYGFLSENAPFASLCESNNLIFIGPRSETIDLMGLKDRAKEAAATANVPVIPGYKGNEQDPSILEKEAKNIGYPLLIKAAAGGGGKGMVVVESHGDFRPSLDRAKREAMSSFSNDAVLLERYFPNCKHIEVQVFGDGQGNAIHMFERECSLQRRHQKVIEEAPSPSLSSEKRQSICQSAVDLAKSVKYRGAGTIEYIYIPDSEEFYFLEMNTRLQVEHPVTEMVTGWDLVRWQLYIAENDELPHGQEAISLEGHSVECRLYAEDPENDFRPSPGKVYLFLPNISNEIRFDSGLNESDNISFAYDPMVAKTISWGNNREEALLKLKRSLKGTLLWGPKNNLDFLIQLLDAPFFVDTTFNTRSVENDFRYKIECTDEQWLAISTAFVLFHREREKGKTGFSGFRNLPEQWERDILEGYGNKYKLKYGLDSSGNSVVNGNSVHLVNFKLLDGNSALMEFEVNGRFYKTILGAFDENQIYVSIKSQRTFNFIVHDRLPSISGEASKGDYCAPMPGKVVKVLVGKGDEVQEGQQLLILEAMKMENEIKAFDSGIVESVLVKNGEQVEMGKTLIQMRGDSL